MHYSGQARLIPSHYPFFIFHFPLAERNMAEIIEMPKLSDTMTVGTLVKWLKQEGDAVKTGDMLAEVETDKATMELECFFDGVLLKLFSQAGSQVPIGAPLCAVGQPGEQVETPKNLAPAAEARLPPPPAEESPKAEAQKQSEAPAPAARQKSAGGPPGSAIPAAAGPDLAPGRAHHDTAPLPSAPPGGGVRQRISPLARKFAKEKGIDCTRLQGSGRGGRIVRADIVAAEAAGIAKTGSPHAPAGRPAPSGPGAPATGAGHFAKGPIQEERAVAVGNMRGTIARRLLESKTTIPHLYLDIEVDAGPLLALRRQLNTGLEADGVKLSVNDFILKASVEALRRVPAVNASWEGSLIRHYPAAHLSFAVAMPDGLITPVIRDAHVKTVFQLSAEAKTLGQKAKDKKLTPAEFTGGTFCVSNLGMMGVTKFNAIINPPNSAILGVGATVTKPVVKNGMIVIGQTMTLTLGCDHRVVDGALGAQYLSALKTILENPALLLV
jgi:pyruvate dehydrogenase E2 component (dihydrolipoamide acetyltransferase)